MYIYIYIYIYTHITYTILGRCNAHCEAGTVNITVGPVNGARDEANHPNPTFRHFFQNLKYLTL